MNQRRHPGFVLGTNADQQILNEIVFDFRVPRAGTVQVFLTTLDDKIKASEGHGCLSK